MAALCRGDVCKEEGISVAVQLLPPWARGYESMNAACRRRPEMEIKTLYTVLRGARLDIC